jgi:hypothetical protein
MKTNININVKDKVSGEPKKGLPGSPQPAIFYPELGIPQMEHQSQYPSVPISQAPTFTERSIDPSQLNTLNDVITNLQSRDVQLRNEIEEKHTLISVLEQLLTSYEDNPLIINKCVVCEYKQLIEMIKVLCGAEKVELVLGEDVNCTCGSNKFIKIGTILVTKDGVATEFKRNYNDKYTLLTKHGISTKMCVEK